VDPAWERIAFSTYRRLLPGWSIVGIDASEVIKDGGALHCILTNIPANGSTRASTKETVRVRELSRSSQLHTRPLAPRRERVR
jgi:hypothetical protein